QNPQLLTGKGVQFVMRRREYAHQSLAHAQWNGHFGQRRWFAGDVVLVLTHIGRVARLTGGSDIANHPLVTDFQAISFAIRAASTHSGKHHLAATLVVQVLAFFIIVGLRMVFEIPVELRSNWIFRLMLDAEKHECEPLARKVILVSVLPWALLVSFPIYAYLGGWAVGCLHTLIFVAWSLLL